MNAEYLYKISDNELVAKANKHITSSYSKNKKLTNLRFWLFKENIWSN